MHASVFEYIYKEDLYKNEEDKKYIESLQELERESVI